MERMLQIQRERQVLSMAKTKTKKQKAPPQVHEVKGFHEIKKLFPKIRISWISDAHPGRYGRDFVTEVILPKDFTLITKSVAPSGEVLMIKFSVQAKHCMENQKPGIYAVSA